MYTCTRQSPHKQLPCIAALQVQDLTPNIGMWWYFCAEMFPWPLPWFKACFHLGMVAMASLITWRLWRTPVLGFLLLTIMLCFLKPYPSVADAALFMVKPLLPQLLKGAERCCPALSG